jgi:hypothetical protein
MTLNKANIAKACPQALMMLTYLVFQELMNRDENQIVGILVRWLPIGMWLKMDN